MNLFPSAVMTSLLLQTVAWPVLVVTGGMALGLGALRRMLSSQILLLTGALTISAAMLTAYHLIYGKFTFPPVQALDWVPLLIAGTLPVFAMDDLSDFGKGLRFGLQTAIVILAAALLLQPVLAQLPIVHAALILIAVSGLWLAAWIYFDHHARDNANSGMTLLIVSAGAAVVSVLTGSMLLGQLGGALAAVLGAWLLWNWPRSHILLGHAGTAVAVMTLGSILLVGCFYSAMPLRINALLLVALAANVPVTFILQRYRRNPDGPLAVVLTGVAALLPVALAVVLTVLYYLPQGDG
ncbi:MAG: MraY family glycosyltransferase [Burkholderiales bacterium]